MKKLLLGLVCLVFLCLSATIGISSDGEQGRIKIYLQNKCSSDVKVYVKSPGSSTKYTVDDGYKKPFEFLEGTKVYDEDGRKLIVEVTSSVSGDTFIVCD